MRKLRLALVTASLVAASIACSVLGSASDGGSAAGGDAASATSPFPMPAGVSNLTSTGTDAVNFQTSLTLTDALDFYRNAFQKQGLTERTITTSVTDTTFSIVFDGDPSGNAIVVQGVDLGNGKTNINIRFEDV
jgi:hypothetical protein